MVSSVEILPVKKVKLSDARASLRLSQRALARRAHVTQMTVSRAEAGKSIRRMIAYAILEVLNAERQKRNLKPLSLEQVDWVIYEEKRD